MEAMLQYDSSWEDMSEYVVHFTKASLGRTAFDNMLSICWEHTLKPARKFGIARDRAPEWPPQYAVCFSEVPAHLMARISKRRGEYGIGFSKERLLKQGGGPIWYIEKNTTNATAVHALIDRALASPQQESEPIWFLTPFIDVMGEYPTGSYRFDWEREWRCRGEFDFKPEDVAFLVLPESFHAQARAFFLEHQKENTGPAYLCPYLAATWSHDQVQHAFSEARANVGGR